MLVTHPDDLEKLRHSLAHLLAAAVLDLYPKAKPSLGPAIDNGFYYDFDFGGEAPGENDLPQIEKKMRTLAKTWREFSQKAVSLDEARELYLDNRYKLEIIDAIAARGEEVTLYTSGGFTDMCRGGHVANLSDIDLSGFKLDRLAGAYWRGDENNPMLTRIYGLALSDRQALRDYEKRRQEAEARDHRKIGRDLEIFTFDEDVGPGLPLWLPNGTIIIDELEKLAKEMEDRAGFKRVRTPHVAKESMYLKSGHLPYYQESMFPPMEYEGKEYYLRAMNCPHHHKIFAARGRSYRDLPLRLAEYGTVYRHEKSGELFGLMRVRMLQMNDAHIYCTEEQFFDEFKAVIEMYLAYFKIFGIEKYLLRLSKHAPDKLGKKYIDEPVLWQKTEEMVRQCLVSLGTQFVETEDEAAFYGPKVDVEIWSAIGREFTLATNQVDFAVPARFGLTYTDKSGLPQTPLCIHRAPLSTHERFIGFLLEHYAGEMPLWLAPTQVQILPIAGGHQSYSKEALKQLQEKGVRAEINDSPDTLNKRVRQAETSKIPLVAVIGDKELSNQTITIRKRHGKDHETAPLGVFITKTCAAIAERRSQI